MADLPSQEEKANAQAAAAGYGDDVVFEAVDTRQVDDLERCAEVAAGLGTLTCWSVTWCYLECYLVLLGRYLGCYFGMLFFCGPKIPASLKLKLLKKLFFT